VRRIPRYGLLTVFLPANPASNRRCKQARQNASEPTCDAWMRPPFVLVRLRMGPIGRRRTEDPRQSNNSFCVQTVGDLMFLGARPFAVHHPNQRMGHVYGFSLLEIVLPPHHLVNCWFWIPFFFFTRPWAGHVTRPPWVFRSLVKCIE
jgi:hypothetical protein